MNIFYKLLYIIPCILLLLYLFLIYMDIKNLDSIYFNKWIDKSIINCP